MSTPYLIAHGHEAEHAALIKAGLEKMVDGFTARICGICEGCGAYEQTYTAGCGGGYFKMPGGCDYCAGTGLRQGRDPAARSVLEQVVLAGKWALFEKHMDDIAVPPGLRSLARSNAESWILSDDVDKLFDLVASGASIKARAQKWLAEHAHQD